MIGHEALWRHLVRMLGTGLGNTAETGADFDALHGVDSHHRAREIGIELAVYGLAPTDRHALGDRRDARTAGIARLPQRIHERLELRHDRVVGDEEGIRVDVLPAFERDRFRAELSQMPANGHAVALAQPFPRNRSGGDSHCGLARRLPAAATIITDTVFLPVRVVRVPRPKRVGDAGVILAARIFVADQERDRRARGAALEHAGEDLDRIRLAPLRHMPRRARFAAVEIALDLAGRERHAWRTAVDDATDRWPVRFAERGDAEQRAERVAGHGDKCNDGYQASLACAEPASGGMPVA